TVIFPSANLIVPPTNNDFHGASRSSSGLGHRPFTAATRVRLPYGTPKYLRVTCDSKQHHTLQSRSRVHPVWRHRNRRACLCFSCSDRCRGSSDVRLLLP